MKKRVALIIGSTSGIGAAIARRFAEAGISVALHSKTSVGAREGLAKALPGASYTRADLADEYAAKQLISTVLATHGQLDILVNNAGMSEVIPHGDLWAANAEIWQRMYAVNVIAPWVLIAEAERVLRGVAERGASGASSTFHRAACRVSRDMKAFMAM